MTKRILLVLALALSCSALNAADQPASEASIKQLLEVTHARQLVDTIMAQMDATMKNVMQQVSQGRPVPPQVQKTFDQTHNEVNNIMRQELSWDKLEPMYVRVYQKTFTQSELDNLLAFYKTPGGQALINKMPLVMQNTMAEVQQMLTPVMQRIQRMQQDMVAQMQSEQAPKKG